MLINYPQEKQLIIFQLEFNNLCQKNQMLLIMLQRLTIKTSSLFKRRKNWQRILCRHVNQKPHHIGFGENSVELSSLQESYECTRTTKDGISMLDNVYSIPHSSEVAPLISGSKLNVQSSNMIYLLIFQIYSYLFSRIL